MAYLDADGAVLAPQDYSKLSVEGFQENAAKALANRELRKKAEAGDAAAKKAFFLLQLDFGALTRDEATKMSAGIDLSGEEKAKLDDFLLGKELQEVFRGADRKKPETMAAAARKCADLFAAGRIPKDPVMAASMLGMTAQHAKEGKDTALLETVLITAKERFAGDRRMTRLIENLEKELAKLRAPTDGSGNGSAPGAGGAGG
ncbi:MAG: hypothetical protein L0216_17745 [Planctomycetales bacterium]|nr:hypothetical protein [Planctomycetales bacterium]